LRATEDTPDRRPLRRHDDDARDHSPAPTGHPARVLVNAADRASYILAELRTGAELAAADARPTSRSAPHCFLARVEKT